MWRLLAPPAQPLADLDRFLDVLEEHHEFFDRTRELVVGRAPGRLDLMGGIADYSGSLVLELPLASAAYVAVQEVDEAFVTVRSPAARELGQSAELRLPLAALLPAEPLSYAAAHTLLTADGGASWAAYVLGALVALAREHGVRPVRGLRMLVASEVPAGKGVSSSAAIEVAAMTALCALYGVALDGRALAILCQRVENLVVGAPCGVMDQMTAALGEQGRLLALLCQPAEPQGSVPLPPDLEVWGIDSGIRHAVSGADYGSVRVGAFMGYRIIAENVGLTIHEGHEGHEARQRGETGSADLHALGALRGALRIDDRRWGGYLANIPPSLWESALRGRVPETIRGAEFLAHYGGTTDSVTQVDPARTYAVRQPTAHPIYEHHRVRLFRALLEATRRGEEEKRGRGEDSVVSSSPLLPFSSSGMERFLLLGELMFQSHASYSACGLGSDGTDRLVELVREAGPATGLFGAKITGGGSGGTVAVLARRGAEEAVRALAERYKRESGRSAAILGGSSPGAVQLGALRMRWLGAKS
jgi:galactokinase